jgi:alkylation response protein AidB-like acyl-CoA dehydrogenase
VTVYTAPLADIRFVLQRVAGLTEVASLPGLEDATPDTVDALLSEAARLAERVLAPLNQVGDRHPATCENGAVRMPPGFREAWRTFAEGGWTSLAFPRAYGGQELPRLVNTAAAELWTAANLAFQNCPLLTQGAIDAILHHGTAAQRQLYATRLIAGTWTGAMCLTEPQAGSDVGALRTRAVRDGDRYRLYGTKIFITFGEHDLAENIVHLVLARIDGAPDGTSGISLFIVPKFLPDADGRPGRRNDFRCVSIEHKPGLHASPTCVMTYGDGEGAEGFLLGEENRGMRCMFTMMNNARLAVGHQGLGLAERAYQQALAYAQSRVQGSRAGGPVPIVKHPDVRRMLLTMRAQIAAMRALAYWTAAALDRSERHPDAATREEATDRVALLTPLVKAWLTDLAQEIAANAVLVHGGVGYVEETGVAQHFRDARILAIYEGTNGIQGLDLVGRKLDRAGGKPIWGLCAELRVQLVDLPGELQPGLEAALAAVERTTRRLQASESDDRAAGASPYLRLLATTVGGFLLARGARAGSAQSGAEWPGLARLYVQALLPPAMGLEQQILMGAEPLDPVLLTV